MCEWKGVHIEEVDGKGFGVFANEDLPEGFRMPYGGKKVSKRKFDNVNKSAGRPNRPADYVLTEGLEDGKTLLHVDAHPDLYDKKLPLFAWLGSFCNAASPGSFACNAQYVYCKMGQKYDHCPVKLYVELTRPVSTGEEISADYRYTKTCLKNSGIVFDEPEPEYTSTKESTCTDYLTIRSNSCKALNKRKRCKRENYKKNKNTKLK